MNESREQHSPSFVLREIDGLDDSEVATVARLHAQILDFGPMSGLGERFVKKVGYELPLKGGLLRVTLGIVEGTIAGFVAHTTCSGTFQRETIRSHIGSVIGTLLRSMVEDPRRLRALVVAMRVILSRDRLAPAPRAAVGEFAALVVRPEFTTVEFFRRTRLRIGEELTRHVIDCMRSAGMDAVRGFVDAHNKAALLMYQRLGAQFLPCLVGGRSMVQVSFNFERP